MKNLSLPLVLLSALASSTASAVILSTGDRVPLPGSTVAERPNLAGTVVEDDLVPFSYLDDGLIVSGTVQNRVVLSVDGTYDFYWRVLVDQSRGPGPAAFRVGDFYTDVYDADWKADGVGDVSPKFGRLFGPGFVNFEFFDLSTQTGSIAPGQSSYFMFFDTDATGYARTAFYDFSDPGSNEISESYATFAPVPEPASIAALALGLGALLRRRRRI